MIVLHSKNNQIERIIMKKTTTSTKVQKPATIKRQPLQAWVHYLIATAILVIFSTGVVAGWNLRSENNAKVTLEASHLVAQLK